MKLIRHTKTLFYYDGPQVIEARDAIGGHYPKWENGTANGRQWTRIFNRFCTSDGQSIR